MLAVSWQIDAASESKAGSHVLPSGEEKTVGKLRFAGTIRLQKQSLSARLGDSFYFAKCKIVESLLRRGARDFSLHFATQTQQKPLWGRSALESWSLLGN